jgi:hypothetical protein
MPLPERPNTPDHHSRTRVMPHTRLIEILDRKRELVARLAELARRQESIVRDGRTDTLLDLLGRRQSLIDEMLETQDEFVSLMRRLGPQMDGVPVERRRRIDELVEVIGLGLAEIVKHDDRDRAALKRDRETAHRELHALGSTRRAHAAYAGAATAANRFADRRG